MKTLLLLGKFQGFIGCLSGTRDKDESDSLLYKEGIIFELAKYKMVAWEVSQALVLVWPF